jgi:hypothetical protein
LRAEFWNGNASLITYQYNSVKSDSDKKHLTHFDQLLLETAADLFDLSKDLQKQIHCPSSKQKPLGLRLYNVHETRGVHFDQKTKILYKPIKAWYILSCERDRETDHGDLELTLTFRKLKDQTFTYLPNGFRLKQKSCQHYPSACK